MTLECVIVTQERTVFNGAVDAVNLPGTEGRLGILPHHTPLLTTLGFGEIVVRRQGQEEYFAIGGGLAEVQPTKVIVLADSAEHVEEIDISRAEAARQRALQLMAEGVPEDPDRYAQVRASLQRAEIRIDVARRRRHHRTMPTGTFPHAEDEG